MGVKVNKGDLITAAKVFRGQGDYEKEYACLVNLYHGQHKAGVYDMIREYRAHLTALSKDALDGDEVSRYMGLLRKAYLLTAREHFDDYMIFLEWDRSPEKKFWLPRRRVLWVLCQDLEDLFYGRIRFLGVSLPPRTGKALAYDTPVLTRDGWKKHGELTILDKVIGLDGEFKSIYAIHTPCEMQYEIEFADGEKIQCHGNHEWVLYDRHLHKTITVETKTLFENGVAEKDGRRRYFSPQKGIVVGEKKALYVDPYTLGAWLGDGRNRNPDICGAESDFAIVQKILDNGYELAWDTQHKVTGVRYYGFRGLRGQLQEYGMCRSKTTTEKHIPSDYLTASVGQRLELLAGLLDTDGTLKREEHRYSFTTNEPRLRDDFISLVNTFGWRTSVVRYECGMSKTGIYANKPYWAVSFNPTMSIPCQLERKQLHVFSEPRRTAVAAIRKIEAPQQGGNCISVEGGVYCVGRTLKPTHNSTLGIFFMSWVMGNRPDIASVMTGHSDKLTDGFYREILSIITDDHTYNWGEVFPNSAIVDNSAKNETIDLVRRKRFPTFTARSISGTLTGAVEVGVGGILYCDDLIEDLEEALNPDRLDAKYQAYLNQLKDRKKDGALELMVGTRWNVFDPLGRIEEQYRGNPDYRFRVIPAVNKRGESNFDYPYQLGFSTQYYRDMKESIEPSEWAAKYMGAPYIREGLLYPADSLRRFYRLPEGEADAVWAICDPAQGGGDDTFLPVCYQYGEDHYLVDCVCTDALPNVSDELCAEILCKHKVSQCQYEINAAGGRTADVVSDKVAKLGGPTSITKRHTQANKETKILANSTWVKDHVLFLDGKYIKKGSMYEKMMRNLTLYTLTGKNAHDDVPDGLAQYAQFIIGKRSNVATLSRRFF